MRILFILGIVIIFASPVDSKIETDARINAVNTFSACIKGENCDVEKVFDGDIAINDWKKVSVKIKKIKIKSFLLWKTVSFDRYSKRLKKIVKDLDKAGINTDEIKDLGHGKAIVKVNQTTSLALVKITFEKSSGKENTEGIVLVLKRPLKNSQWKICYWEDSLYKIKRHLIALHKN